MSAWLTQLTAKSRATQLLHKDHHLLSTLEETMNRYLKDVKRSTLKADKRYYHKIFKKGHISSIVTFDFGRNMHFVEIIS